jgi:hypothetical protein
MTAYNPIGVSESVFSHHCGRKRGSLYLIDSPFVKSSPHGERLNGGEVKRSASATVAEPQRSRLFSRIRVRNCRNTAAISDQRHDPFNRKIFHHCRWITPK